MKLEQIRQAGICRHYDMLKNQGLSPGECLQKTADFAQRSSKHIKGILTSNVQKTGRKKIDDPVVDYMWQIDSFVSPSKKDIQALEALKSKIQKDKRLYDKLKDAFSESIDSKISSAEAAPERQAHSANNENTDNYDFRRILDILFESAKDDSDPSRQDIEQMHRDCFPEHFKNDANAKKKDMD
jgi:hypothetical protein